MTTCPPICLTQVPSFRHAGMYVIILLAAALLPGCSRFVSSVTTDMAGNLSDAFVNHGDLDTVEYGGPAHMLMIDGFLRGDPDNETLLELAAGLYTAYTAGFVTDRRRAHALTDKALGYALHAVCLRRPDACGMPDLRYPRFQEVLSRMDAGDVPALYALGLSWAVWIQSRKEDVDAVAQISRVEGIMQRVIELNEAYQEGQAHVYMGILATLLPPVVGGKPEEGRRHFERAVVLSGGRNLMAKVACARYYARMVFDRPLHDRLLREVLEAEPEMQGFTLQNTLAQKQARELLDSGADFF